MSVVQDLRYCKDTRTIEGRIPGNATKPYQVFGYVQAGGPAPPAPPFGTGQVAVFDPATQCPATGDCPVTLHHSHWPQDDTVNAIVWEQVYKITQNIPVTVCGSAAGHSAPMELASQQVHDVAAGTYHVEVSGFRSQTTKALNGGWDLELQSPHGTAALWSNGGDAETVPHVALAIESLCGADVLCTLKLGKFLVEYRAPGGRWQPLGETELALANATGVPARTRIPETVTVRAG